MLVSRRVEDHLRPVRAEREVQALDLADVADDRHEGQLLEALLQLEAEGVHRGLGVVEEHELLHTEAGQLPAELGADGAGRAGHHDHLILEVRLDGVHRNLDFLAAQQVLDLDVSHLQVWRRGARDLIHRRSDEHLHAPLGAEAHEVILLRSDILFTREDDAPQGELVHHRFEFFLRIEVVHLLVGDHRMLDVRPIGDEAHHFIALGAAQAGGRRHRLVFDAVDQHALAALQLTYLLLVIVVDVDHQQAHRTLRHGRGHYVEKQQHEDLHVVSPKQNRHQGQDQAFADRSRTEQESILEGEMTDDDDVSL